MILTPHIIIGAAIGAKTHNLGLIIILGLLSHVILDKIPHWDYTFSNILNFPRTKNFKMLTIDLIKIAIDGLIGLLIVFLILWQKKLLNFSHLPFILLGIFISVLPDIILGFLILFVPPHLSGKYFAFHHKYLHFKHKQKEGKFTFPGLLTQILVIVITILFFFS